MYKIIFYEDGNGKSEITDFLAQLHECAKRNLKDFKERGILYGKDMERSKK